MDVVSLPQVPPEALEMMHEESSREVQDELIVGAILKTDDLGLRAYLQKIGPWPTTSCWPVPYVASLIATYRCTSKTPSQ